MAFITKKDLLSSEICISWVPIGADVYVSVTGTTYSRVYKSTGGGPLTQILNLSNTLGIKLFAVGTTLYAAYYVNPSMYIKKLQSGVFVDAGYINGANDILDIKIRGGIPYVLTSGVQFSGFAYPDSLYKILKWSPGTITSHGSGWALIRQSGVIGSGSEHRHMYGFDYDVDNDVFYIAENSDGLPGGSGKIIKLEMPSTETVIQTFASTAAIMSIAFADDTVYFIKRYYSGGYKYTFSRLTSLDLLATEETLLSDFTTDGGTASSQFGSASELINGVVYLSTISPVNGYITVKHDTNTDTSTQLDTYTASYLVKRHTFGNFFVDTNEIIKGVIGKFVYEYVVTEPGDPTPDPPAPVTDLTEEIIIEVRPAPCNPITLCWINSLGGWEHFCFEDINGTFETEIKTRIESEYERYVEQLDTDTNFTGITTKEIERSIKLGADAIDPDIFVGLLDLFTSPAVFMLVNEDPITWQSVRVSAGSVRYSDLEKNLEFTLELPNMFIQRS
jgi:hypothetical protein